MFENKEGQRVPEVNFRFIEDSRWVDRTTTDLFAGKTVVVFALPGAFTPTCSTAHVPRYGELHDALAAKGVDDILCMSVNDGFVMNAWKQEQNAPGVRFVPDGNGEFAKGLGLLVDKKDLGFGRRSWRYSMLVRDGIIEKMFIEPDKPGDPFEVSDADTMLRYLDPDHVAEPDVLLLTKPGCGHCARAKSMLRERGLPFAEISASPRMLRAVSKTATTPQAFIDGRYIGGADELAKTLAD
ncbi:MAG: glutathione peroxidase [Nannocystaceae bacterium]|nr:glutathione peroxidase [Nannocystaceae bacterium]